MTKHCHHNLPRLCTENVNRSNEIKWFHTQKKSRYPVETITDPVYADHLALLANTPAQAESLLHSQKETARGIGLYVNSDRTEFMCFKMVRFPH